MTLEIHRRFIDGSWHTVVTGEKVVTTYKVEITPETTTVEIGDAAEGATLVRCDVRVIEAFNGSTPTLHVLPEGGEIGSGDELANPGLTQADANASDFVAVPRAGGRPVFTGHYFREAVRIFATLDDGDGGHPGSTVGLAIVSLIVAT